MKGFYFVMADRLNFMSSCYEVSAEKFGGVFVKAIEANRAPDSTNID